MYKVIFLPTAEESFRKLDTSTQRRIAYKIDWLSENADKIVRLPTDLGRFF
jgi:mRNA-degrading endonuclease RelE of RelBE toxin-antitoxin system